MVLEEGDKMTCNFSEWAKMAQYEREWQMQSWSSWSSHLPLLNTLPPLFKLWLLWNYSVKYWVGREGRVIFKAFFAYIDLTEVCCVSLIFILVKAGGMRIVQKHPHNSDAKEEKDKDDQDWETSKWAFWFGAYATANFHDLEPITSFVFLTGSKPVIQLVLYHKIDLKR